VLTWKGEKSGGTDFQQPFLLTQAPDGVYFVWIKVGQQARTIAWVKKGG